MHKHLLTFLCALTVITPLYGMNADQLLLVPQLNELLLKDKPTQVRIIREYMQNIVDSKFGHLNAAERTLLVCTAMLDLVAQKKYVAQPPLQAQSLQVDHSKNSPPELTEDPVLRS